MIEDLLTELSASGWTISWAFQFAPGHWRVSIIQELEWDGVNQPDALLSHCADAPTFAEALETAMTYRNVPQFIPGSKTKHAHEPQQSLLQALSHYLKPKTLNFVKPVKFDRRI